VRDRSAASGGCGGAVCSAPPVWWPARVEGSRRSGCPSRADHCELQQTFDVSMASSDNEDLFWRSYHVTELGFPFGIRQDSPRINYATSDRRHGVYCL
jgi:hypothetical protein